MAAGINFEQPTLDWSAPDLFQEFKRFLQHVEFSFLGPLPPTRNTGLVGLGCGLANRDVKFIRHSRLRKGRRIQIKSFRNSMTTYGLGKTNVLLVIDYNKENNRMVKHSTTF